MPPLTVIAQRYGSGMQLGYTYRLNPTPTQRQALTRAFGCARVVFNDGLRLRQAAYRAGLPYIPDAELLRQVTTVAKKTPQRAWLGEVSAVVLQHAVADLNTAYRNYFDSLGGKRTGRRMGPPRYRSKKARQSIRFTRNARFQVLPSGRLRLPKIGAVAVVWSRPLPADPSSVTVTLDNAGRYHASFVVDAPDQPLPPTDREIGVDLGLAAFVALSDGTTVPAPKYLRCAERRLKRAQRQLSRKQAGSANRAKARRRVARLHARVTDQRRDFHHKLSTRLIRDNQAVYVEDLAVGGLARTRLAKSVHDAGWGTFLRMLAYKATRHHRTLSGVDRWLPSTQTCSGCGHRDGPKPLDVRAWTCPACATIHDRDVNAARVILAAGRAERQNACGGSVRPGVTLAVAGEAGTHRGAA
jgi:IS605 OrfB family transposase